jgi:ubiquinone/menaquinone biosynthesis C-methylase UbiE
MDNTTLLESNQIPEELLRQAFDGKIELVGNRVNPEIQKRVENWVNLLPAEKKSTIIELAAGDGSMAKALSDNGINVQPFDLSPKFIDNKVHPELKLGSVDKIDANDHTVDGIYILNALPFINPDDKHHMFEEAMRVLKPGGSIFIQSQVEATQVVIYQPKGSNQAAEESGEYTDEGFKAWDDDENWQERITKVGLDAQEIGCVYYVTTARHITDMAKQHGFIVNPNDIEKYQSRSEVSKEDIWSQKGGFFLIAQKPN